IISSTLGAALGGTTRAGQQDLDCSAFKLISPLNSPGGVGRYLESRVSVAAGEHGGPVGSCARAATDVKRIVDTTMHNLSKPWCLRTISLICRTFRAANWRRWIDDYSFAAL